MACLGGGWDGHDQGFSLVCLFVRSVTKKEWLQSVRPWCMEWPWDKTDMVLGLKGQRSRLRYVQQYGVDSKFRTLWATSALVKYADRWWTMCMQINDIVFYSVSVDWSVEMEETPDELEKSAEALQQDQQECQQLSTE